MPKMFRVVILGLLLACFPSASHAQETPQAIAEYIYSAFAADQVPDIGRVPLSARFAQALEEYEVAVGPRDFALFISGQDVVLTDLRVGKPVILDDQASVLVSFRNFGQAAFVVLHLVAEAGRWSINDIAHLGPDFNWLVSDALAYRP